MFKKLVRGVVLLFGAGLAVAPHSVAAETDVAIFYSDPVYWPLHVESYVDCTTSNPGCSHHHSFWGVDVIPTGQRHGRPLSQAGVYSMGAGIAHIGNAHGNPCGWGGKTDFGTWVWVDHGAGVVSKYGHLSSIDITDGQQVGVGDLLGRIGNTGDGSKLYCDENYLDFQVRRDGVRGPSVEFSTTGRGAGDGNLLGCSGATAQSWPAQLPLGIGRIDALPEKTNIPGSSWDCLPGFEVADLTEPHLRQLRSATDSVTLALSEVPTETDAVRVEIGRLRNGRLDPEAARHEEWRDLPAATEGITVDHLIPRAQYRFRVWFHTGRGWQERTEFTSFATR